MSKQHTFPDNSVFTFPDSFSDIFHFYQAIETAEMSYRVYQASVERVGVMLEDVYEDQSEFNQLAMSLRSKMVMQVIYNALYQAIGRVSEHLQDDSYTKEQIKTELYKMIGWVGNDRIEYILDIANDIESAHGISLNLDKADIIAFYKTDMHSELKESLIKHIENTCK